MSEKYLDTSLLDKAIIFATNAHKNTERRGKAFPYIVHPLEVVSIVATMTNDQELLAAAALHDVVEDTNTSLEDIKNEFGDRVASIVGSESDDKYPNMSEEESWKLRKQAAIDRLSKASLDIKMVALGDKLSNARQIFRDFQIEKQAIWDKFHVKDIKLHEWHYRGLVGALCELQGKEPYEEFKSIVDKLFIDTANEFSFEVKENIVLVKGFIGREESYKLEDALNQPKEYLLDFTGVTDINFACLRTLFRMHKNKVNYSIFNASTFVFDKIASTGLLNFIQCIKQAHEFDMSTVTQSGDGYTALSYFSDDNDSMVKFYHNFVPSGVVLREKRVAQAALQLGISTPICGDLLTAGDTNGITFERVFNKRSIARAISEEPENVDKYARMFAEVAKELHSTECDTQVFDDCEKVYKDVVSKFQGITDEERIRIIKFIDKVEKKTTCIHGDFHFGNVIFTDKGDKLFIDMADFSYGNPLYDIGTLYFMCHNEDEAVCQKLYHTSHAVLLEFWYAFSKYYFNISSELEQKALDEKIEPFAGLKIMFFGVKLKPAKWMIDTVHNWVLKYC